MEPGVLEEFDLTGKSAIVTGGNRGIGRGIALGLARAGANVVVAARDEARNAAVVKEITDLGRCAVAVKCDVTDRRQLEDAVGAAVGEFGNLSILVNNAGMLGGLTAPHETNPEWDHVFQLNLKGAMAACQAAYPFLCAAGGGKIINISSAGTTLSHERAIAYAASKAGVEYITRALATAWGRQNIQVNAIAPGVVLTEMQAVMADETIRARVLRNTPAGRAADAEEFGAIAVFLASPASDFITGQCLLVDGGVTIKTMGEIYLRD